MKPISSSNWKLGCIYGGAIVAAINPVAGAITATVLYRLYKSRKAVEDAELELKATQDRANFRRRFYERQAFASYDEYLGSAIWREKRTLVLQRSTRRCEHPGCNRPVEEVHHKRYPEVWGNEPIDWLVALCVSHHREAHGKDSGNILKR